MNDLAAINQYPIQNLAYLGDAVMELLVREHLIREKLPPGVHPSELSLRYVTAAAQSEAAGRILHLLDEEEDSVYRRGRNNIHSAPPKSATASQYRRATGLECLFAFLYITGKEDRMKFLFNEAYGISANDDSISAAGN